MLCSNQIDIYHLDLNEHLDRIDDLKEHLDVSESARAARFKFARDRNSFILSHAILRFLLSQYLNCSLDDVKYKFNSHDKPSLLLSGDVLQFNLSHSHEKILLAFTNDSLVGVDVEHIKQREGLDDIVGRYFSKEEVLFYQKQRQAEKTAAFYKIWVQKEAFVKAVGQGIGYPLKSFMTSLYESTGLIKFIAEEQKGITSQDWHIAELPCDAQYRAAVVWNGCDKKINLKPPPLMIP